VPTREAAEKLELKVRRGGGSVSVEKPTTLAQEFDRQAATKWGRRGPETPDLGAETCSYVLEHHALVSVGLSLDPREHFEKLIRIALRPAGQALARIKGRPN